MEELLNISPIDGRYKNTTEILNPYLSEYALIKYRTIVEIKWLLFLIDKNIIDESITNKEKNNLLNIIDSFSIDDAKTIKDIEHTTNHDVKSIEYFLRDKFKQLKLERLIPFIHITLTSEDINNVSYNLMINDALNNIYYDKINELVSLIDKKAKEYKDIPMLGHTHGHGGLC